MAVQKNCCALNAKMFVGVCLQEEHYSSGLWELNSLIHERPEVKLEILTEGLIN
jgi:hypothetical protein